MRVRPATVDDLLVLQRITAESEWTPRWAADAWRGLMRNDADVQHIVCVAEDSAVCGFAVAGVVLDVAEVESMAVAATYRRHGVARQLLRCVWEQARAVGCVRLQLEVDERNTTARHLYEACGFAVEGRRERYYKGRWAAILMGRVCGDGEDAPV